MDKLLIMGGSKGTKELLKESKERGIYTIITDNIPYSESNIKMLADEYWDISTGDYDKIERKCKEIGITAIINGISGFNLRATIELTKRLSLPCYCDLLTHENTLNKRTFKNMCSKNEVKVARDYVVDDKFDMTTVEYPVVVKPTNLSANRGLSYCNNKKELLDAIAYARDISGNQDVIVEKMLIGHEYTAWYALAQGKSSLINFSKMYNKEGYPASCYSITTTLTDKIDLYLDEVDKNIKKVFSQAGCAEGIAWIEMMLDRDGHFYVLEMGHRLSGDMMALVHKQTSNFDAYSWLIDIAVGKKHSEIDLPSPQKSLCERIGTSYILWSKCAGVITKIKGLDEILRYERVNINVETTLKIGTKVNQYQYLAIITFDTKDYAEMCTIITMINNTVEIWNENENIVIYFDELDKLKI